MPPDYGIEKAIGGATHKIKGALLLPSLSSNSDSFASDIFFK
jgi:hypothetical protein